MIRLLWALSAHDRYYLRRYMPTNIALDAIRTRCGLKWGIPVMLLCRAVLPRRELLSHPDRGWRPQLAEPPRTRVSLERSQVPRHGPGQRCPPHPRSP